MAAPLDQRCGDEPVNQRGGRVECNLTCDCELAHGQRPAVPQQAQHGELFGRHPGKTVHLVWHGDDQPAEEVGQDLGQLDVDAGPALPILHHLEYRAVEPSSSLNIAAGLRDTPELPRTEERLPGGPSELRVLSGSPKPQAQPPKGSAWPGWPSSIKRDQKKAKQT